jgi:hypothetical protein
MTRFAASLARTIEGFRTLQRIQFAAPWREGRTRRC